MSEESAPQPVEPTPASAAVEAALAPPRWAGAKYGFYWGTGRRKTASVRVRVREGTGQIVVNGKPMTDYFPVEQQQRKVEAPLRVADVMGKYDVFVRAQGGGPTGQAGAVTMGLARALCSADQGYEAALRGAGLLTRDSRMKERKKPGQRGARRKFQFSKR